MLRYYSLVVAQMKIGIKLHSSYDCCCWGVTGNNTLHSTETAHAHVTRERAITNLLWDGDDL